MEIGQYSLSFILALVLGSIWKAYKAENRFKPLIAEACGVGLGILALWISGKPWTPAFVAEYVLYGFVSGAAAVGIYEGQKSIRKPRQ